MKKSRFTEIQIVKILKGVAGGRLVKEVCREYGILDATYYRLGESPNELSLLKTHSRSVKLKPVFFRFVIEQHFLYRAPKVRGVVWVFNVS